MVTASGLRGVHVALATPIAEDGRLDRTGLAGLLDRVIAGGVDAVCPTGSTGEGPRLTRQERRAVTLAAREHLGPGLLLLPAASAMSAEDALAEIQGLADEGADGVLLAPPSYYPMGAGEVVDWYSRIADDAALPLVLYNIPAMTTVSLPAPAVADLARHPQVLGIKDSSRDLEYLESVLYAVTDAEFTVLTGSDTMLLASLQLGAHGTIAASANLVPQLSRSVYDATLAGDLGAAREAQRRLFEVVMACRAGVTPAGWKAALHWAGVCSARLVSPARPLDERLRRELEAALERLGVR